MKNKLRRKQGITIISLVITIIVLLILAGVSLAMVFNQNGIFKKAEGAKKKYSEAEAREVLETVLLASGQYEKRSNPKYNQDGFLNALIKREIPGADIKGNIVIISGYAYEINRSVPKVEKNIGKSEGLVFPKITVTKAKLADDYRTASFTVTAKEEKNGINKIEVWLEGKAIESLTQNYSNEKTEITLPIEVSRDGEYIVKVYGDLMISEKVTVEGIVPSVEFTPNGSGENEWKKSYTTQITVRETGEKVTDIKYIWTTDGANEPGIEKFTEGCPEDNKITGKGEKNKAETYYLWILITTESGKKSISRSNGFNIDNAGPEVELTSNPTTNTSFTLTATAKDTQSGIKEYEFYIEDESVSKQNIPNNTATYTWSGTEVEEKDCYVIVRDLLENETKKTVKIKMYAWDTFSVKEVGNFEVLPTVEITNSFSLVLYNNSNPRQVPSFSSEKGYYCENAYWIAPTSLSDGAYFVYNGEAFQLIRKNLNSVTCTKFPIKRPDRIQGASLNNPVCSFVQTSYPENGEKNGIWYVKRK